jgi:hypothetical protein
MDTIDDIDNQQQQVHQTPLIVQHSASKITTSKHTTGKSLQKHAPKEMSELTPTEIEEYKNLVDSGNALTNVNELNKQASRLCGWKSINFALETVNYNEIAENNALQEQIKIAKQECEELERKALQEENKVLVIETSPSPALDDLVSTLNELFQINRKLQLNEKEHLSSVSNNFSLCQAYLDKEQKWADVVMNNANHSMKRMLQQKMLKLRKDIIKAWTDRQSAEASLVHAKTLQKHATDNVKETSERKVGVEELEEEKSRLMNKGQPLTALSIEKLTAALSNKGNIASIPLSSNASSSLGIFNQLILDFSSLELKHSVELNIPADERRLIIEQNKRLQLYEREIKREWDRHKKFVKVPFDNIYNWCEKKNIKKSVTTNQVKKASKIPGSSSIPFVDCLFFGQEQQQKKQKLTRSVTRNKYNGKKTGASKNEKGSGSSKEIATELKSMVKLVDEWKTKMAINKKRSDKLVLLMENRLSKLSQDHNRLLDESGLSLNNDVNNTKCFLDSNRPTDLKSLTKLRQLIAKRETMERRFHQLHGTRPSYSSFSPFSFSGGASNSAENTTKVGGRKKNSP